MLMAIAPAMPNRGASVGAASAAGPAAGPAAISPGVTAGANIAASAAIVPASASSVATASSGIASTIDSAAMPTATMGSARQRSRRSTCHASSSTTIAMPPSESTADGGNPISCSSRRIARWAATVTVPSAPRSSTNTRASS